jgi:hypothetical protein
MNRIPMDGVIEATKLTREAQQRLLEIAKQNSWTLTPEAVVDDARDPGSPLHASFEWDDSEAARKYRLDQARTVIRAFHIVRIPSEEIVRVPLFVRDPRQPGNQAGYVHVDAIRDDRILALKTMRREIVAALAIVHRVKALGEELGMAGLFEATIAQFDAARTKVDIAMAQPQQRPAPGAQPAM